MSNECVVDVNDLIVGNEVKTSFSAMEVFSTPRVDGEKDLVGLIYRDMEAYYCKEARDIFISNTDIVSVAPLNPFSQRVIINRWFNGELLKYRSRVENVDVVSILSYVINDGDVDTWLECMQVVVLPFFKLNNILNIQLGE